ncbi:hypothetical protein [Amycolatopsis sp. H20-H5]|uniref:hypothetical protein n=1 Tax=Amycolatopsis sp. H20-H5 TaxID=3046309 RepID=UPI002DBF8CD8|nr:hypothetical protein [Amycolatopsis sp. H20-H5]MEC3979919.1 hypothetical protein [Amycolatopsis sp. H20-H5]
MSTADRTHTDTTTPRRARPDMTARAGFFTGRGNTSTLCGVLTATAPNPLPDPATLATLPVGRALLNETTDHGFHASLSELVTGWHAAGFGGGTVDLTDPWPYRTCPPPDGNHDNRWAHPCYAFDDGQVLYYVPSRTHATPHGGQWHTVTLAAGGRPRVDLVPASRLYGEFPPRHRSPGPGGCRRVDHG